MLNRQELEALMLQKQNEVGSFKETRREKYQERRINRLSKFTPKMQLVIDTLTLWGLRFTLCEILHSPKQSQRITTDIFVPDANIVIRQVDVDDEIEMSKCQLYYNSMKACYYPLFVRSNETEDFIITKMNNLVCKAMETPRQGFKFVKFLPPKREKRKRVIR